MKVIKLLKSYSTCPIKYGKRIWVFWVYHLQSVFNHHTYVWQKNLKSQLSEMKLIEPFYSLQRNLMCEVWASLATTRRIRSLMTVFFLFRQNRPAREGDKYSYHKSEQLHPDLIINKEDSVFIWNVTCSEDTNTTQFQQVSILWIREAENLPKRSNKIQKIRKKGEWVLKTF